MSRGPVIILVCLLAAAPLGVGLAMAQDNNTWTVKVTNMTKGQPMSPPLWAVHDSSIDVWSSGRPASNGVALIAEDAFNGPLQGYLADQEGVLEAGTAPAADPGVTPSCSGGKPPPVPEGCPILPGASREFDIELDDDHDRLTMLWMLVRTNDAFTGLDAVQVREGNFLVEAYDAGTERNTERCAEVPGPPCAKFFVRDQTVDDIAPHQGIRGGDLAGFKWNDPVARVEITRG